MDYSEFEDIRGYEDSDVSRILSQCFTKTQIKSFINLVFAKKPLIFRFFLSQKLNKWFSSISDQVHTINDFQQIITAAAVEKILKTSSDGFAVEGLDNIANLQGCFFISNHRDIILDAALFCYALFKNGKETCYNAFGDNLIVNPLVEGLLRINKCFIVKRNLPMREQFFSSKHLSSYINCLLDDNKSVWIAQRDGRSKDGSDITKPTILKMLNFSKRDKSIPFKKMMDRYKIVPISISYEWDPCDKLKARELYSKQLTGNYVKKPYEDLNSMLAGIQGEKGRISLNIGEVVITKEGQNEADIALEIDRAIHQNYKLWPSNYAAWDLYNNSKRFSDYYSEATIKKLKNRMDDLTEAEQPFLLIQYANPVQNQISEGVIE